MAKVDDQDPAALRTFVEVAGSEREAARQLGIPRSTLRRWLAKEEKTFRVSPIPDREPSIPDLLQRREEEFDRRRRSDEASAYLTVDMPDSGPIGLMFFGDHHLDDPGCDIGLVRRHTQLCVETDGCYAVAVGDLQNGWPGKLAHLYGTQSTSAREAASLMEWWISELGEQLIVIIGGNHDCFAKGVDGRSALEWIASLTGTTTIDHGARIELRFDFGHLPSITINARHDFDGYSMWNTAHGIAKAAIMGTRDDILVAGHTHVSGYNVIKDPLTGKVSHAIRVASYKKHDDYVRRKGMPDQDIFECPLVIIDPKASDIRRRCTVFFDPFLGAKVLKMLRMEAQRARPN